MKEIDGLREEIIKTLQEECRERDPLEDSLMQDIDNQIVELCKIAKESVEGGNKNS